MGRIHRRSPLVEALNVGAIQVGWTGDAPPIFGQSSGAAIFYIAALPPNGDGEAIITKAGNGIEKVADLKGRKVAVGKGTSAHNLLVAALEANGLQFSDVEAVYLSPADANRDKVAEALHEVTGAPLEAQKLAADRAQFGIFELTPEIITSQQATADRFFGLGLLPAEISIQDAVRAAPKG